MKLLELRNLNTFFYTKKGIVKAVEGISFNLEKGKSLGIAGESGCGKTTAALSILRLLPSEAKIEKGEIFFSGKNILDFSDSELRNYRWKDISIIFQGAMNSLNPVIKVGKQTEEAIVLHENISKKQARKRISELFKTVELDPDLAERYPHEFSGGMKQKTMIALALSCYPQVVIGDEPTTALDIMVQAQIINLFEKLKRELSMSTILISHDLSLLAQTCEEIIIMYAGKIIEKGTTEQVITNSAHPYTKLLVDSFPDIYSDKRFPDSIPGTQLNPIQKPKGCYFAPRCVFSSAKCFTSTPELSEIEKNHYTACHLYKRLGVNVVELIRDKELRSAFSNKKDFS